MILGGWQRAAALLGAVLVAAVVVTLRHHGPSVLDSMWAEDGAIFVQQAIERGPLAVLFEPYAGYLHVPSRLTAALATAVPIDLAAAVMSGGAALAVGALAVFVYIATEGVVGSRALRAVLAASVVLTPVARIESLSNISNVHFSLLFAAFWALLWMPTGRAGNAASSVVVAAAVLADPLAVLLVPVAVRRWMRASQPSHRAPVLIGAVCLAFQVLTIVSAMAATGPGDRSPDPVAIVLLYPLRVVGGLLLGLRWSADLWGAVGALVTLGGTLVLAAVVAAAGTSRGQVRTLALLMLGTSGAVFASALWLRFDAGFIPGGTVDADQFLRNGVRYLLAPILLLLSTIVLLVDRSSERIGRRPAAVSTVALVVVVGLTSLVDFSGANRRTTATTWAAELAIAREGCATGGASISIPIAPDGWQMTVACDVLRR